jgi:hypothetical protein
MADTTQKNPSELAADIQMTSDAVKYLALLPNEQRCFLETILVTGHSAEVAGLAMGLNEDESHRFLYDSLAHLLNLIAASEPPFAPEYPQPNSGEHLIIGVTVHEFSPVDEIADELFALLRDLNAYHIACGGSGLVITDWQVSVPTGICAGVDG